MRCETCLFLYRYVGFNKTMKAPILAKIFLNQLSLIRQCDNISNTIKVS